jgi:hypothetical protein
MKRWGIFACSLVCGLMVGQPRAPCGQAGRGLDRLRERLATQELGVFDDIAVSTGEGTTSFENDGNALDGWAVTGPPAGSAPNPNNFELRPAGSFKEGPVVATPGTLFFSLASKAWRRRPPAMH